MHSVGSEESYPKVVGYNRRQNAKLEYHTNLTLVTRTVLPEEGNVNPPSLAQINVHMETCSCSHSKPIRALFDASSLRLQETQSRQHVLSKLLHLIRHPCEAVIVTRGDLFQHFFDPLNYVLVVLLRRLFPVRVVRLQVVDKGRHRLGNLLPVTIRSLSHRVQVRA